MAGINDDDDDDKDAAAGDDVVSCGGDGDDGFDLMQGVSSWASVLVATYSRTSPPGPSFHAPSSTLTERSPVILTSNGLDLTINPSRTDKEGLHLLSTSK